MANDNALMAQNLESRISKHDAEIAGIRADIRNVQAGLDGVASNLSGVSSAMGDIKTFMQLTQANKPLPAIEQLRAYLGIAQNLGVLMAMVVASIVYVAGNANSGDLALMRHRLEKIDRAIEWRPTADWRGTLEKK